MTCCRHGDSPRDDHDQHAARRPPRPIVGSYGGRDRILRRAVAKLEQALTAAGVPHDVKEYPQAGHAFLNDHDGEPGKTPPLFAISAKLAPGMGYHEESARDARRRIIAFFDAHLKTPANA